MNNNSTFFSIIVLLLLILLCNSQLDTSKALIKQKGILGNIIVASKAISKGETILSIPASKCLFVHREGSVRGLLGQTDLSYDICGDLRLPISDDDYRNGRTWDIQLAVALLDATSRTGCADLLWDRYLDLLPIAESVSLPFCMSYSCLTSLHNPSVAVGAIKQKKRLSQLFPLLSRYDVHPASAACLARLDNMNKLTSIQLEESIKSVSRNNDCVKIASDPPPTALEWAFAMVRSRCFQPMKDWFAMVPVVDMANHVHLSTITTKDMVSDDNKSKTVSLVGPSARYVWDSAGRDEPAEVGDPILEEQSFSLQAVRDIEAGEEVTISYYSDSYSNDHLLVQYGFHMNGNNEDDKLWDTMFPASDEYRRSVMQSEASVLLLTTAVELFNIPTEDTNSSLNSILLESEIRLTAAARSLAGRLFTAYWDKVNKSNSYTEWLEALHLLESDLTELAKQIPNNNSNNNNSISNEVLSSIAIDVLHLSNVDSVIRKNKNNNYLLLSLDKDTSSEMEKAFEYTDEYDSLLALFTTVPDVRVVDINSEIGLSGSRFYRLVSAYHYREALTHRIERKKLILCSLEVLQLAIHKLATIINNGGKQK